MAKPRGQHLRRGLLHGPAEHGHGVGVIQENRPGAELPHVPENVQHHRNRAQEAENARGIPGVAHVDLHAVLFADVQIVLEYLQRLGHQHAQHAVRALQGLAAVRGAENLRGILSRFHNVHNGLSGVFQIDRVNIYQVQLRVLKGGIGQNVPHQIAGKDVAARADENEFFAHESMSPPCLEILRLYYILTLSCPQQISPNFVVK